MLVNVDENSKKKKKLEDTRFTLYRYILEQQVNKLFMLSRYRVI